MGPCSLVKTSEEIDAAITASASQGKVPKTSRDFIKRVAAVSGITSACGVPERAPLSNLRITWMLTLQVALESHLNSSKSILVQMLLDT